MRFSGVKIEKLFAFPTRPLPNQFYLIETGGTVRLYISDTDSNLHLLNENYGVNTSIYNLTLTANDSGLIITDKDTAGYREVTLPEPANGLEFEFWVIHGNGLKIRVNELGESIRYTSLSDTGLQSDSDVSTVRLQCLNDEWIVRFATGTWNVTDGFILLTSETGDQLQSESGNNLISEV